MVRRILIAAAAGLCAVVLSLPPAAFLFINFGLPLVPGAVVGEPARPDALGPLAFDPEPVRTAADWRERRAPALRTVFAEEVYGRTPPVPAERISDRETLVERLAHGGRMERFELAGGPTDQTVMVTLVLPAGDGPFPVILQANPCGARLTLSEERAPARRAWRSSSLCGQGLLAPPWLARYIFGDRIFGPPVEQILARGFAYATFHESEIAPDDAVIAPAILAALAPAGTPDRSRPGVIAGWAWGFARVAAALETHPVIDPDGVVVAGHSRRGKAVLWAAALSDAIDVVISHQSGTGGASLSRSDVGETVAGVTAGFPHWFALAFAEAGADTDALAFDQHLLLALVAPRPLLLSNADRDQWSDPHGAFRAAQGASAVFALLGAEGLAQSSFADADLSDVLAVTMRQGRHGLRTDDWTRFLTFAAAHVDTAD